jgi:hypothetical protein
LGVVGRSVSFVWFVLFVWLFLLNETNQMNQINQINQTNQMNQAEPARLPGDAERNQCASGFRARIAGCLAIAFKIPRFSRG